ncbi:Rossmann-like and DUF2520 domain-containing protein [Microbacterium sp. NIBRBAC000506063]|uniref:Rossmann-like and DUF2520 domain-containing protein n=1 Tax=Microbacterium sp. NIBRBAC000506063 TaxID=2734618 RepID=UPI001BB71F85|nr:Rossmann-like and DUF2520 domain-containing protein [Microbacterium sp. NIBRBAC000506063]QTV78973.1 DUF2520 domain-containing protein [Microbacterium sp. NIBRBAC000506063]
MNPSSALSPEASVAIIGAGRLGGVLAGALRHAGFTVQGPLGRGEAVPSVDVALLCVPDAAIAEAAQHVRGRTRLIGHVSGATPLDDVDFSLHPLQTFTGEESPEVFHGIGAAVAGRTDDALAVATHLAEILGALPFEIDDACRAAYHAAASLASNLVLTVLDAAEQVADAAGIPQAEARALLTPLVRRTVENWSDAGAAAALTGPIARGDEGTVARQRTAIAASRPDLLALFDELCASTRSLAGRDSRQPPVVERAAGETKRSETPTEADRVSSRSLRVLAQRPESEGAA